MAFFLPSSSSLSDSESAASSSSSPALGARSILNDDGSQTARQSHRPRSDGASSISDLGTAEGGQQRQQQHERPFSRAESDVYTAVPTDADVLSGLVATAGVHVRRILRLGSSSSLSGSDIGSASQASWDSSAEQSEHDLREEERAREERKKGKSKEKEPEIPGTPFRGVLPVSASANESASRTTRRREPKKRRRVYSYPGSTKYEERGFTRDFLLIVGMCLGLACFIILFGRLMSSRVGGLGLEAGMMM